MSYNYFGYYEDYKINIESELKDDISALVLKKNKLDREQINFYTRQKPLIVHCCHHKTGTVVIEKILRTIASHYGLKYQYCSQSKLKPDTDIWVENHSKVDFSLINRPIIGTHMIRHPCSIIVSAYEYHKKTNESWVNRKIKSLGKQSYKEIMNSLSNENGLLFEMKNELYVESSRNTIMDIYNWDYYKPNFLELKFEDLMVDFDGTLRNMFKHYGFSRDMIEESIKLSQSHNIRNKSKSQINNNNHITNKSIDLDKWKKYFESEKILNQFKKTYPKDLFEKLGYETQDLTILSNTLSKQESNNMLDKYWSKNLVI